MAKKKNIAEEFSDAQFLKEMSDEVPEEIDEEGEEPKSADQQMIDLTEDLMERYKYFKEAIETNQKIIKKLWERIKKNEDTVKKLEDDFKLLIQEK